VVEEGQANGEPGSSKRSVSIEVMLSGASVASLGRIKDVEGIDGPLENHAMGRCLQANGRPEDATAMMVSEYSLPDGTNELALDMNNQSVEWESPDWAVVEVETATGPLLLT
jgi:hypothetical protein